MSLSWTKKHVAAMADVLDADHVDLDSAARAALDQALSIIEERGKWAVVGQVYFTPEHGEIPPKHEAAVKVCLGLFDTDTKANEAAAVLSANANGDRLRTWVVPTFYGTPAAWHKDRRDYYAELEAKADEKRREKIRTAIDKREAEITRKVEEIRAMEAAAGGQQWPCWEKSRVECRHSPTCQLARP